MRCRQAQSLVGAFIKDELDDEQLKEFLDHIENCADCYEELEVSYMVTEGLAALDHDVTGTFDLKKSLQNVIRSRRKRLALGRRRKLRRRIIAALFVIFMIVLLIFYFGGLI